jgi:hypothetical protein
MPDNQGLRAIAIKLIMGVLTEDRYIAEDVSTEGFLAMTVEALKLDIPPLPSDANFDKEYLTRRIKKKYLQTERMYLVLSDDFFRTNSNTIAQLVDYCSDGNNLIPVQ